MRLPSWLRRSRHVDPVPPPVEDAAPARLDMMAAYDVAGRPATKEYPFRPQFEPAPGVLPAGVTARGMAMDAGFDGMGGQAGLWAYAETWGVGTGYAFVGYPYLAQLTQIPEYRRPTEIIAKEMTREWIKLVSTSEDGNTDRLKLIEQEFKRLGVQAAFEKAAEYDGFFGGGHLYLDFGKDDPVEMRSKLVVDPGKVNRKNPLKYIKPIEPMWLYPNAYNSMTPWKEDFFRPETWFVMANEVHTSRLINFISRPVPDILKPSYMFRGMSLSQMLIPYVNRWLRTVQSVNDLINAFSVMGIKVNMAEIMNQSGRENLATRLGMFNATRDNRGLFVLDKETEEFFNTSVPLGSLDKLQAQAQEHMSGVTGIPLIKMFGITPTGLNASSEGEIRVFYDWIKAQQEEMFGPALSYLLSIVQLSLFDEIDDTIGFEFNPLWQPDEATKAATRKADADTAAIYIDRSVIDPAEERERLARAPESIYSGLDLNVMPPPIDEGDEGGDGPEDTAGRVK